RLYRPDGSVAETIAMSRSDDGAFELNLAHCGADPRYRYVVDGEEATDPFARALPGGVDAPAALVQAALDWSFPALGASGGLSIYELHVGCFTPEGTYRAATSRLPYLADLGVGAIELMPVAAFAGSRGWGYDGVAHFAPFAPYGTPQELAAFVDEAHRRGLRVLLDVVYNHFGPRGNHLRRFVPGAFTTRFASPWGETPDYANPIMREYVLANVRYWLEHFRFDGLRLDATHAMHDDGPRHILREITKVAHGLSPRRMVFAEDDRNDPRLLGEHEIDAVWADDFHHQTHVTLTGERDGYYAAYEGGPSEIARTIMTGWCFEGQRYTPWGAPRGAPATGLPAEAFVYCLQNHDQVGNRALGERITRLASLDGFAAATLVLLTLSATPLLFMGQEWAATTPFLYFTDHDAELGLEVTEGRRREFAGFGAFRDPGVRERIPNPQDGATFASSHLAWDELASAPHARIHALHRALLRLRAEDPVLREPTRAGTKARADHGLLIVDRTASAGCRRVIANFGRSECALSAELTRGFELALSSSEVPFSTSRLPPSTAALLAADADR
ncbi:MAG: malto-oligosyltrehalose trehalohydrolase, partial [Polyangiaceae bacterium]